MRETPKLEDCENYHDGVTCLSIACDLCRERIKALKRHNTLLMNSLKTIIEIVNDPHAGNQNIIERVHFIARDNLKEIE